MTRSFNRFLVLASLMAAFAAPAAFAGGMSISLFGVGVLPQNMDIATPIGTLTQTGKFSFGGGASVEAMLSHMAGLEFGASYVNRKYGQEIGGADQNNDTTVNSLYIPVGLRVHFNRYLSVQAGGFYDLTLETGGNSNFGLQGGLRISVPMGQKADLFVDGRYNLGLKDIAGAKASDLVMAQAGLTFHMGGKN